MVAQQLDRDVDHLVWELRPTALDDLGLQAALATHIQNWSKRACIAAELHTSGLSDDRLASQAETTLYRIAQEALTNVAKHSRARHVDVILERRADQVVLIVEDDGVGFDPGDAGTTRQGLGSVRHAGARLAGRRDDSDRIDRGQGHDDSRPHGRRPDRKREADHALNHPLRILLADDHVTVRHGLKLLIDSQPDMKVVAEASDGNAAVERAVALKPDVIVMDISMPGMNGLVATRKLKQLQPGAAIVTLTRHADDAYLQELLRAGVSGYVLKQSAPTELLQAIRAAAAGGQYLDSALTARVTAAFVGKPGNRVSRSADAQSASGSRKCCG